MAQSESCLIREFQAYGAAARAESLFTWGHSMNTKEKLLYHQIHPLKLLADVAAGFGSFYPLWRHWLAIRGRDASASSDRVIPRHHVIRTSSRIDSPRLEDTSPATRLLSGQR
jgi:hypothetical protein